MKVKTLRVYSKVISLILLCGVGLCAADPYQWEARQIDGSAQLFTLYSTGGTPLVSVLRDDLGSPKISYVWLLTDSRPTFAKRVLSAVPFFYFHAGNGSAHVRKGYVKPLINLAAPQRSSINSSVRNVIQWTVLDPMSAPVRASSRAYETNHTDANRLRLATAASYLRNAPAGYLTEDERNTILARISLRTRIAGDFVNPQRIAELGEESGFEQERIRQRNWELLRQCADKTGLVFEPIDLAGAKNEYVVIRFPALRTEPPAGAHLPPIWKLMNIKNPYAQKPLPVPGTPLAVYSLTYPKMPLLMIDLRDSTRIKRHELTQRAINEVTAGVIGVSHFTNWYYFVAADLYDFWASRRGTAVSQQERLNAYSKFRAALSVDKSIDPDLRALMQKHLNSFSVNPLETSPENELRAAKERYAQLNLTASQENGPLLRHLENDRRHELARFEDTRLQKLRAGVFHYTTFGLYTQRAAGDGFAERLAHYREAESSLDFVDSLVAAETAPEVTYDPGRIQVALERLTRNLGALDSPSMRIRAERAISKLNALSADNEIQAQCRLALNSLRNPGPAGEVAAGGASVR